MEATPSPDAKMKTAGVYMGVTIPKDEARAYAALTIKLEECMEILETNECEYLRMVYLQGRDKRLYDMLAFHGCQGGLPMPGGEAHP